MNDRFAIRMIVVFIGVLAVMALNAAVGLYKDGMAEGAIALVGLVTTCLSILAPSPLSKLMSQQEPLPVQVANKGEAEAVPVEPAE